MASILNEYLSKKMGILELQTELQNLIAQYNKHTGRYMFVYAADINKNRTRGIDVSLVQDDFYNIQDILRESNKKKSISILRPPEEVVKLLRKLQSS